jgi:hypothetical protein
MRCLIAISSCGDFERNGNNQAMRETWLPDLLKFPYWGTGYHAVDYKFFFGVGQDAPMLKDSVILPDLPDDYGHLTYKTQASLRWADAQGYDFVFRCFPDTYVRVERLLSPNCPFFLYDYYGDFRGDPSTNEVTHQRAQNYASGGPGYWLSRRAFELLLEAPVLGVWRDEITPYAEDLWVGNILGRSSVPLKYFDDTKRFINRGSRFWPTPENDVISSHLSCPERYDKATMYAAHWAWSKSLVK